VNIFLGHLSGEALRFATTVGVFSRMVHSGGGGGDDDDDDDDDDDGGAATMTDDGCGY
jgi:hypothetical protein